MNESHLWRGLLGGVSHYRLSLIVLPLAVGMAAALVAWMLPPRYEALVILRPAEVVFERREGVEVRHLDSAGALASLLSLKEFHEKVLANDSGLSERLRIRSSILRGSELVEIRVSGPTPEDAFQGADQLSRGMVRRQEANYLTLVKGTGGSSQGSSVPGNGNHSGGVLGNSVHFVPMRLELAPAVPKERSGLTPWDIGLMAWGLALSVVIFLLVLAPRDSAPGRAP